MTLRRKLALASALAVLLTSLAATALVYFTVSQMQVSQIDRQLVLRLQASDPRTLERELRRSAEATSFSIGDSPAYLFDAIVQGRRIPDAGVTSIVTAAQPQRPDAIVVSTVDVDSTLVHHVRLAQVRLPSGSLVRVMRSIDDINTIVRDIGLAVALIGTGFAIISAVAIALLVARGLRPLQALATKASEAGKSGDFRPLLAESERAGSDEVAELSHSLGFMAGNVIDSRERQRRLVDDAAHELRTPLTSLRTNLQLLQQSQQQGRPLSDEVMRSALEDCLAESSELADLTEELVALAATGGEHGTSWATERVDVNQLVADVVFRASRRSGRDIEFRAADSEALVDAIRPRLERAVANIVGNATKFAPQGPLRATVTADAADVSVVMEDAGPGIAPEDRQLATARFWRAAATRGLPGSGLGLAIVADVAQETGGRVEIGHSHELGGARIALELPRAAASGAGNVGSSTDSVAGAAASPSVDS